MSVVYPASLLAVGGARTGVAPVNLLDVQDVNGNLYHWSDRPTTAQPFNVAAAPPYLVPPRALNPGESMLWLLPTAVATQDAPNSAGGISHATLEGGILTYPGGGISAGEGYITWSAFDLGALPPAATLSGAYEVAYYSQSGHTPLFEPSSGTFNPVNGQWQNQITTSLAAVEAATIEFLAQDTVPDSAPNLVLNIWSPALAVYFTGGSSSSGATGGNTIGSYLPWLIGVPELTFHRSAVTDIGSFKVQNLSGDTLSRDFERIVRRSALEGAQFVFRCWQGEAQAAWIEVHGNLTVQDIDGSVATLKGLPNINGASDETPDKQYCETCQWRWGSAQCGASGNTECEYSFQTCQVVERFLGVVNNFEKNYGETVANVATQTINRRRRL